MVSRGLLADASRDRTRVPSLEMSTATFRPAATGSEGSLKLQENEAAPSSLCELVALSCGMVNVPLMLGVQGPLEGHPWAVQLQRTKRRRAQVGSCLRRAAAPAHYSYVSYM